METKKFTHRLYIDEYNAEFVNQLSNNKISGLYATDESTDKVIVVSGTLEDLTKLSGLMYRSEDDCKAAFPSFITEADFNASLDKMLADAEQYLKNLQLKSIREVHGTGYNHADPRYLAVADAWSNICDAIEKAKFNK